MMAQEGGAVDRADELRAYEILNEVEPSPETAQPFEWETERDD